MARYEELTVGQVIRTGINNGTVTVLEINDANKISKCKCATGSIPSATAGYAVGCELIDTTTGHLYVNTGSITSCTFNDVGAVAAGEITLATGSILVGTAGVAAAVDGKTTGNVFVGNGTTVVSATPDTAGLVATSGAQSIAGVKTFTDGIVVEDGEFKLGAGAGTAVTATATELNYNDITTLGTGAASKAVVLDASGNYIMPSAGLFGLSRGTLAATGSGAADAAVITQQVTAVTGSNGTLAVALPAAAVATGPILVINTVLTTGATLPVFPVNGGNDAINGGAEDAAFTMGPGKAAWFIPTSATQWYVDDSAGVTSTKAELSGLTGVTSSAAEINYNDITTAGTAEASKAVVLDASKDHAGISNLTLGTIGATGVVGKAILSDGQNPGYKASVYTDAQSADINIHIPDPGALVDAYLGLSTAALTAAEMDVLDGATSANSVASKAAILDAGKALRTNANVGAANTGVTAVEYGDGYNHTTVLTVSQADAITVADNAALADGYLLYTLPAGACIVNSAYMTMAVTLAEDTTATADVGLGTTIGSGASATLDLVAAGAAENLITGQTTANCSGTATVKTIANQVLVIETGGDHTIYFNVADTWADTAGLDLTGDIAGTVVLNWSFMA